MAQSGKSALLGNGRSRTIDAVPGDSGACRSGLDAAWMLRNFWAAAAGAHRDADCSGSIACHRIESGSSARGKVAQRIILVAH